MSLRKGWRIVIDTTIQEVIDYLDGISYIADKEGKLVNIECVLANPEKEFFVEWEGENKKAALISSSDLQILIYENLTEKK